MEYRWNDDLQESTEGNPPSVPHPTRTALGLNPDLRGEKSASNRLNYSTSLVLKNVNK